MEASTGPLRLQTPPIEPSIDKIKHKFLQRGVVPTPKIIHTLRKKEIQKLNRRLAKEAAKQLIPLLTDSQKQLLAEESNFQTIKSEYKKFTKAVPGGRKMVGRPWESLDKLKMREFASESIQYGGEKLKTEHLRELSNIMESEKEKFQWLLDDDIEVEEGWLENESDKRTPPKRRRSEAEEIRFFVERLSGTELSVKDWKFSRMMKQSGLQFTEKQMLKIVEELGCRGQWRHALSVVEWVYSSREHKYYKSRFVCTKLLAILGKARRPKEALQVFNYMRGDGHIYPDMAAYRGVAVALAQVGLLWELLNIIQLMKERPKKIKNMRHRNWDPELQPDVVIYNAVLNACVPSCQWRGVSWVFEQLRKSGLKPNGATYGLAMEVMLKSGKYDLVHEFFGKMKRSGEALKSLTYKVLVRAFWEEGKVDEAFEAVRDMEQRGIIGTACVYYELARCLCFHGRCQEAILEVEKLRNVRRTRPLEVTFTGMILAALDGGHINDCFAIYEHCKKNYTPDIGIVNAVLKVCRQNDMFLEAKELYEETKGRDIGSESSLNDLSPDVYTFRLMLEASASAQQWEYFEYVYKDMTLFGYRLDQSKYASLLVEASRAGKWALLEHAFDAILEAGEIPHLSFFTEMLCQAAIQHDYDKAARISNAMAYAPFQVSEQQWIALFEENKDRISKDSLKQFSEALCNHNLATEGSILNLSSALKSVCGDWSSSGIEDSISYGNEMLSTSSIDGFNGHINSRGSRKISDTSAKTAVLNPPKNLQLKKSEMVSVASFNHNSNWIEEDSESDHDFTSTLLISFQKSNLDSVELEDISYDSDEMEFEVSASGNDDFDEFDTPSANEILKIWKDLRKEDGISSLRALA